MFNAEVKYHDPDREYEEEFETRDQAVGWLREQCGYGICRMWLNNDPVAFENGELVSEAIRPASEILRDGLRIPTREEMERVFRPQPTRGMAPTNPATLAAKGEGV